MHMIVQIYSNQVYSMLQLFKNIKYFKDKSFIYENTIAYLHKYMIHINHLFKVYYL